MKLFIAFITAGALFFSCSSPDRTEYYKARKEDSIKAAQIMQKQFMEQAARIIEQQKLYNVVMSNHAANGGEYPIDNFSEDENSSEEKKHEDGTHTATVDYYNPETGERSTYTLDVEVEDGEVVKINFPKGGWLDESHIRSEELDEDGHARINGEDGKTYDVEIVDE